MFRVIGVGKIGCSVANHFADLPQYDVTLLNEENLGTFSNMEECEKKVDVKKAVDIFDYYYDKSSKFVNMVQAKGLVNPRNWVDRTTQKK